MRYSKFEMIMRQSKVYESRYEYKVTCDDDVYRFAQKILEADIMPEEHFWVISVASNGGILGFCEASKGCLDQSIVSPREVFRTAIMQNAGSILVVHNHPSGSLAPSGDDITATQRLKDAGDILGIKLLDHVIVSLEGYFSFRSNGYV